MMSSYALRTVHRRTAASLSFAKQSSIYRSSHLGYSIAWGSSWTMTPDDAERTDPSTEELHLQGRDGRETITIVCADRRDMLDPDETVRFWKSPFYLAGFMDPGTIVMLSDHTRTAGAVVMVGPDEASGEPMVTIKETFSAGYRTSVRVTLTAPLESFEEAYRHARETVQMDHQPMFRFFGPDVLKAVLD